MPAVRTSDQSPAAPAPAPMLVPVGPHQGRKPLTLNRSITLIGSTASARLYLPSKAVSRCHAAIINTGGGLFVRDLASRTRTRINGQVVNEADLREGDVLQVGTFTFQFTDPTAPQVKPPALPAPAAALEVDGLDEPLALNGRATLIGRRETADISLMENSASSAHTLVLVMEGRHLVRDLNSRTGTFVNGVKVHEQVLSPGDVLRVGETDFRYTRVGAEPAGAAARAPAAAPKQPASGDGGGEVGLAPVDDRSPSDTSPPSPNVGTSHGSGIALKPADPEP